VDDWVLFLIKARVYSPYHVYTNSGAQFVFYPLLTEGLFTRDKTAEA
jgi:hypothetical protein